LQGACVTLSQGACQPRTSEDGQSQYRTTSKTTVCCPRGTYLARVLSCTIVTYQIRQEGGNLPSWSKKQRAFSLKLLLVALSVSFNWFSTKETKFCRKASNFAYFSHLYFQSFRLAYLNKGHLYVTPIGESLRMRLVPGPQHAK